MVLLLATVLTANGKAAGQAAPAPPPSDSDADHIKERNEWFFRGRIVHGKPTAELRRRAYHAKLQMRAQRAAALAAQSRANGKSQGSSIIWTPLGPVPLASDASGNGTQDYRQVSGRATAVAIDPADPSGNTVYIGGAQSGVWKSTNAATPNANSVTWTPVTDDQATLSIGAIAIQPGNTIPANTVILAATGEGNSSGDSYFGLGILRSTDAGNNWTLVPTANGGALSFSGLGGTRMAFNSAAGQTNAVVAAMATTAEGFLDGAVSVNTMRGLYTSLDAGQTWTYDALSDPGGATDATSATFGRLQRERGTVLRRDSLSRLLLFSRRSELDASGRATRRFVTERYRVPAAIHFEQSRLLHLPSRNHCRAGPQRDVCVVRLFLTGRQRH